MNIKTETLTEIKVSVFAIRARGGPAQVDAKNIIIDYTIAKSQRLNGNQLCYCYRSKWIWLWRWYYSTNPNHGCASAQSVGAILCIFI